MMTRWNHNSEEARQPVFDTEDLADEKVAKSDPEKKSFWSKFALRAILSVNLADEIEPKRLSDAEVDRGSRGVFAGGLTQKGFD